MSLSWKGMPDCCWRYLHGINSNKVNTTDFKRLLIHTFCVARQPSKITGKARHVIGTSYPGGVIFCGSHGDDADAHQGLGVTGSTAKSTVIGRLDLLTNFIEEEGLGKVERLPRMTNWGWKKNPVEARVWIVEQKGMKAALTKWCKEVPNWNW